MSRIIEPRGSTIRAIKEILFLDHALRRLCLPAPYEDETGHYNTQAVLALR